jgi:hypothetical protein
MVKVSFDNLDPRIMPEMSARVAFLSRAVSEGESRPVLAVHRDALVERDGTQGIFQIDKDRVKWVPVDKPEIFGDYLLLASIMQGGERIVLKPPESLNGGNRIKTAE